VSRAALALLLAGLLAAPADEPGEVVCSGQATITGIVLALDVVTVFALPRGASGNGRKFVALTVLEDGGGTSRVLVPWGVLLRGLASAPHLGDSVALSPEVEVLQGFATPQWVARGFSVVPQP
jgi:hypothetical protein